jgi:phage terminase small subunit
MENLLARPRTPTAVLELRGAFKNHPSRLRDRKLEPLVTTPLPEPPKYLTKGARAAWREMESWGFWLTSADQFLVAIAATYMAAYRGDKLKSADISLLIGLLNKIGFSPAERRKLNLPTRTDAD